MDTGLLADLIHHIRVVVRHEPPCMSHPLCESDFIVYNNSRREIETIRQKIRRIEDANDSLSAGMYQMATRAYELEQRIALLRTELIAIEVQAALDNMDRTRERASDALKQDDIIAATKGAKG